ncbi:D-serine ammonia-lyase [Aerococcaceae bacterium DSM 111020]|nr:D-serine ammonia-lyase [Aerococcaceae bacterium DSM 111020]
MSIQEWKETIPQFSALCDMEEIFWVNPNKESVEEANRKVDYSMDDILDASKRLERFAPFIKMTFSDTEDTNGIIESFITEISDFKQYLTDLYDVEIPGKMYLKRDDSLPIAGTIKARGAIYEVLKHAEALALDNGLLESIKDDYTCFSSEEFHQFFSQYQIVVGTTGNLGISVGTMARALGFNVVIHMSVEAKEWKKAFLRERGVTVIEHNTNFTEAVNQGRQESLANPNSYFVDDEHSVDLFMGYTVGGLRLKTQLEDAGITVDKEHPLFVYLPCGIGGSPGGITFGLKQVFGDNVYCFFSEPAHMSSMLLGLMTQNYDKINVNDVNIEGKTVMDGLAVPQTSGFVAELMEHYFDGGFTVSEDASMHLLAKMYELEDIPLEPAALAGTPGPAKLHLSEEGQQFLKDNGLENISQNITHLAWATGGSMVPVEEMKEFIEAGKETY